MYAFRTLDIPPKDITLLTESGYLMLVKSFTDDLAWKVQRELVNNYFKQKPQAIVPVSPPPYPASALLSKQAPRLLVDTPRNREAQQIMGQIRNATSALPVVLAQFDKYRPEEAAKQYLQVIDDIGMEICGLCGALARVPLKQIEAPR